MISTVYRHTYISCNHRHYQLWFLPDGLWNGQTFFFLHLKRYLLKSSGASGWFIRIQDAELASIVKIAFATPLRTCFLRSVKRSLICLFILILLSFPPYKKRIITRTLHFNTTCTNSIFSCTNKHHVKICSVSQNCSVSVCSYEDALLLISV